MKIERSYQHSYLTDLAQCMGRHATIVDALAMLKLLMLNGYEGIDTADIEPERWQMFLNLVLLNED